MPTPEQLLNILNTLTNRWDLLATAWYLYFAILSIGLVSGIRPTKPVGGALLALPLLPVSIYAWLATDSFDAILTGMVGITLLLIAMRLSEEKITFEPSWRVGVGILLITAGWLYFPLLQGYSTVLSFYTAPAELVPCPTLMLIIALSLMTDGLGSRPWSLVLGAAGLFYGINGVMRLGISMDLFLIVGALLSILVVYPLRISLPRRRLGAKTP
jgi:hypothetical protein